jgi:hypothetical protein
MHHLAWFCVFDNTAELPSRAGLPNAQDQKRAVALESQIPSAPVFSILMLEGPLALDIPSMSYLDKYYTHRIIVLIVYAISPRRTLAKSGGLC